MTPKELFQADSFRYFGRQGGCWFIIKYVLFRRSTSIAFSYWLRYSKSESMLIAAISKLFRLLMSRKYSMQIPASVDIGPGLAINHCMCMVIHPDTIIGKNCTLHQFLTIGVTDGKPAIIGDNVFIGAAVTIIGNIRIGNNVTIGAGAVVTKDIPDNATVVGNPAKVISSNYPG